jgi:hypothetical protein
MKLNLKNVEGIKELLSTLQKHTTVCVEIKMKVLEAHGDQILTLFAKIPENHHLGDVSYCTILHHKVAILKSSKCI